MSNQNNRKGGNMPKPPAANEVKVPDVSAEKEPEAPKQVETGAAPADSTVATKERKSGIMVMAKFKGFYGGLRRNVGDKFLISGKKAWGSWMECEDKALQKELVAKNKERIKEIRKL